MFKIHPIIFLGVTLTFLVLLTSTEVDGNSPMRIDKKNVVAGGPGTEKPADANVKGLIKKLEDALKTEIEKASTANGKPTIPSKIEACSFRSQIVAGTNYYVKLRVNDGTSDSIWHATVFEQPWTNVLQVSSVKGPQAETDPL